MKGKITIAVTVGIICFILAITMFMQFKVVYQTDITSIESMREDELEAELASWKLKYDEVEKKYDEIKETLNKYKEESSSHTETRKNLETELENLHLMLGTTNVEGQGIIITFRDDGKDAQKISADQLMIIVNYLKDAGAEAISIDGQRIITCSDFIQIDEKKNIVKINGEIVSSPYIIKAIGDPDYLKSTLIANKYVDIIKTKGQEITFEDKKKVEIPKYDKEISSKYIETKNVVEGVEK